VVDALLTAAAEGRLSLTGVTPAPAYATAGNRAFATRRVM
jgi:hypothetical protein